MAMIPARPPLAWAAVPLLLAGASACGSTRGSDVTPAAAVVPTGPIFGEVVAPVDGSCDGIDDPSGRLAHCRWARGELRYCGGPAPPTDLAEPRTVCVCAPCAVDGDCRARTGGRCVRFSYAWAPCGDPAPTCVYEGDACERQGSCAGMCSPTATGESECGPMPQPPP